MTAHDVKRYDFVRRSRIVLRCDKCGTTTIGCAIEDADLYESGLREHVCGSNVDISGRLQLRRMLIAIATRGPL